MDRKPLAHEKLTEGFTRSILPDRGVSTIEKHVSTKQQHAHLAICAQQLCEGYALLLIQVLMPFKLTLHTLLGQIPKV